MCNLVMHALLDAAALVVLAIVIKFVTRRHDNRVIRRERSEAEEEEEANAGHADRAGGGSVIRYRLRRGSFLVTGAEGGLFRRLGFEKQQILNRDVRAFFAHIAPGTEMSERCESAWSGSEDEIYEGMTAGIAYRCLFRPLRKEGSVREVAIIFEDITERKKMEYHAGQAAMFRRIASELEENPYLILSSGGLISYASSAASGMLGRKPEEWEQSALIAYLHPEDRALFLSRTGLLLEISTGARYRCRMRKSDGSYVSLNIRHQRARYPTESLFHFLFFEKETESDPLGQTPPVWNGMERVAASVAHEIRNPLTTIKGISQMMVEKYPGDEPLFQVMMEDIGKIEAFLDEFVLLFAQSSIASWEEVDLLLILREGHSALLPFLEEMEYGIEAAGLSSAVIHGHPLLIKTLIIKILANMIESLEHRGVVRISISRQGDLVEAVFIGGTDKRCLDRLQAVPWTDLPPSRKEFGFGSLIIEEIVKYHNGNVTIDHHPDGAVRVVLGFPAAGR